MIKISLLKKTLERERKERRNESTRRWCEANPEKRRSHGLTTEQYNAMLRRPSTHQRKASHPRRPLQPMQSCTGAARRRPRSDRCASSLHKILER
jgi:hypothetical protein